MGPFKVSASSSMSVEDATAASAERGWKGAFGVLIMICVVVTEAVEVAMVRKLDQGVILATCFGIEQI